MAAPTWEAWRAQQRCLLRSEQHWRVRQQESIRFSQPELARLAFMRWLYQTGRFDPREHDNH
jgi:hypothetical protein